MIWTTLMLEKPPVLKILPDYVDGNEWKPNSFQKFHQVYDKSSCCYRNQYHQILIHFLTDSRLCKMSFKSHVKTFFRNLAAKPRLALERRAIELNCSPDRALFYLFTRHCFPILHFHPHDGVVYHATWKHYLLYSIPLLRALYFMFSAVFICNWQDSGGKQVLRQCFAIFYLAFATLVLIIVHAACCRKSEIYSLWNLISEYDPELFELYKLVSEKQEDFGTILSPSRQTIFLSKLLTSFYGVATTLLLLSNPILICYDHEIVLSPFSSLMAPGNPNRVWWIIVEEAITWQLSIFGATSMYQVILPWLFFAISFKAALVKIR